MVKTLPALQETQVDAWVGKIPWRRAWKVTPVFLPRESHGQEEPGGYSPQGCKEADKNQRPKDGRAECNQTLHGPDRSSWLLVFRYTCTSKIKTAGC